MINQDIGFLLLSKYMNCHQSFRRRRVKHGISRNSTKSFVLLPNKISAKTKLFTWSTSLSSCISWTTRPSTTRGLSFVSSWGNTATHYLYHLNQESIAERRKTFSKTFSKFVAGSLISNWLKEGIIDLMTKFVTHISTLSIMITKIITLLSWTSWIQLRAWLIGKLTTWLMSN